MDVNGHILTGTNIAIDFWKVKGVQRSYIHFLTHLHGDHIVGLTSTWKKPIYCSEVTAALLVERYRVSATLLKVLALNERMHIESNGSSFYVTALDANHCPGAVMFYFEGQFGNILYTGDFRSSAEVIGSCFSLAKNVDVLYLDNTFCSPACEFPSRSECFEKILGIVREHPHKQIVFPMSRLGKETMLGELGAALNEKVVVPAEVYSLCQMLFDSNVFTTPFDTRGCRIWRTGLNFCREKLCDDNPDVIMILPTAKYIGLVESWQVHPRIYEVPYSDHSSFSELRQFVAALRPKSIKPIVRHKKKVLRGQTVVSDMSDMSCFDDLLFLSSDENHSDFRREESTSCSSLSRCDSSLIINQPENHVYKGAQSYTGVYHGGVSKYCFRIEEAVDASSTQKEQVQNSVKGDNKEVCSPGTNEISKASHQSVSLLKNLLYDKISNEMSVGRLKRKASRAKVEQLKRKIRLADKGVVYLDNIDNMDEPALRAQSVNIQNGFQTHMKCYPVEKGNSEKETIIKGGSEVSLLRAKMQLLEKLIEPEHSQKSDSNSNVNPSTTNSNSNSNRKSIQGCWVARPKCLSNKLLREAKSDRSTFDQSQKVFENQYSQRCEETVMKGESEVSLLRKRMQLLEKLIESKHSQKGDNNNKCQHEPKKICNHAMKNTRFAMNNDLENKNDESLIQTDNVYSMDRQVILHKSQQCENADQNQDYDVSVTNLESTHLHDIIDLPSTNLVQSASSGDASLEIESKDPYAAPDVDTSHCARVDYAGRKRLNVQNALNISLNYIQLVTYNSASLGSQRSSICIEERPNSNIVRSKGKFTESGSVVSNTTVNCLQHSKRADRGPSYGCESQNKSLNHCKSEVVKDHSHLEHSYKELKQEPLWFHDSKAKPCMDGSESASTRNNLGHCNPESFCCSSQGEEGTEVPLPVTNDAGDNLTLESHKVKIDVNPSTANSYSDSNCKSIQGCWVVRLSRLSNKLLREAKSDKPTCDQSRKVSGNQYSQSSRTSVKGDKHVSSTSLPSCSKRLNRVLAKQMQNKEIRTRTLRKRSIHSNEKHRLSSRKREERQTQFVDKCAACLNSLSEKLLRGAKSDKPTFDQSQKISGNQYSQSSRKSDKHASSTSSPSCSKRLTRVKNGKEGQTKSVQNNNLSKQSCGTKVITSKRVTQRTVNDIEAAILDDKLHTSNPNVESQNKCSCTSNSDVSQSQSFIVALEQFLHKEGHGMHLSRKRRLSLFEL